ncbi:sporulation protein SsgA [Streptomyces filipinensis]|uniref:Sporulation protein SsgA n=2 Tax=Streptomyces filipinensis TaxID=66887 RepID=A0A918ILT0_9ACTN|nr:sporulation protein SsgA [Streptomyces filipinensis]
MAANGSQNGSKVPPQPGANGSQAKGFNPQMGFTVNFSSNRTNTNNNAPGTWHASSVGGSTPNGSSGMLPEPEFTSPAQIREYCNSLRAAMAMFAFEVSMAAEIMKATLAQVQDPEGRIGASKVRAWKVSRKLHKAAESALDAAKNAAGAYATFQREYEEEINRVRHRARPQQVRRMDWAQQ